jgi:hypothetical protein
MKPESLWGRRESQQRKKAVEEKATNKKGATWGFLLLIWIWPREAGYCEGEDGKGRSQRRRRKEKRGKRRRTSR